MKILILVLSLNDGSIYDEFKKTQIDTWDSISKKNVETYYYYGNNDNDIINGNIILTNVSERLFNCGHKFIKTLDLIYDINFDFIFRTNSSSYVDKNLITEFLIKKTNIPLDENFYCGVNGLYQNIKFASGSGFFLSKKNVKLLLDNKKNFNHNLIDDVAVGEIMQKNNIILHQSERFDIVQENINQIDINNLPTKYFHYRFKTNNRHVDIKNMEKIHLLKKLKNG
jgi:hypothetical protein